MGLRTWLIKREQSRKIDSYRRGYHWAAGTMLSGGSIDEILSKTEVAKMVGEYNDFDMGAEKALEDFEQLLSKNIIL